MYSANATFTGATGILFHTRRPMLSETVFTGGTGYTASLLPQQIQSVGIQAFSVVDNTALYSVGADLPGINSDYHFVNNVEASSGALGGIGGVWLTWGFPWMQHVSAPPGGVGASMFLNAAAYPNTGGVFQYGSTVVDNCPWYLDIINPGSATSVWQPAFWWLTPTVPTIIGNTSDTSGLTTRMGWLWQGVSTGGGTVASVPVPTVSWGTVTSAALNVTLGSSLTLLNNPPMLRVTQASTQSIPNSTSQSVFLTSVPNLDNYGSWSISGTANAFYTAPLPGLYLFNPTLGWGTTSSTGVRMTGLNIVPGGTGAAQLYQGPAYRATPVGPGVTGVGMTGSSVVRVLNLRAGDVVHPYGLQNSGGNLALLSAYPSRMIGAYMSQTAATGTVLTYSAPNPSFRWQAGALSGTALTAALNLHLGNDMSFLMNRPYLTAYQTTPQTFGTASAFNKVIMNNVTPLPYGGNGDNYSGWDATNHRYVSQVAGWYLCVADMYVTPPVAGTAGVVTAALNVTSSGSVTPASVPDQYQQVAFPVVAGSFPPGATAIGLYYLQPGEAVYPAVQTTSWGGTWGTFVSSTSPFVYSQFSAFWVSS